MNKDWSEMERLSERVKELVLELADELATEDQEAQDSLAHMAGFALGRLFAELSHRMGEPFERGFLFGFKDVHGSGWVASIEVIAKDARMIAKTFGERDRKE